MNELLENILSQDREGCGQFVAWVRFTRSDLRETKVAQDAHQISLVLFEGSFPNFRVYGYRNAANKTLQTAPDPGKLAIFSVYDYIENASINRYH